MNLQSFKSQAPISDSRLDTHTTKEDTLNRYIKPLSTCMHVWRFWDMAVFTHGEIQELELSTWRFKVLLPYQLKEVGGMKHRVLQVNSRRPLHRLRYLVSRTLFAKDLTQMPRGFKVSHPLIANVAPIVNIDVDDQQLCSDVQTEAGHMYDELRRSFKLFHRNVNKLTLNVKRKKFMHSRQMTLYDMFKQESMNLDFRQNNCTLNQNAYLSGRLLSAEPEFVPFKHLI